MQSLHRLVVGLKSLRLMRGNVPDDITDHVDELAPSLTHLEELWLPEDCFTAKLAQLVPSVDCSY